MKTQKRAPFAGRKRRALRARKNIEAFCEPSFTFVSSLPLVCNIGCLGCPPLDTTPGAAQLRV